MRFKMYAIVMYFCWLFLYTQNGIVSKAETMPFCYFPVILGRSNVLVNIVYSV